MKLFTIGDSISQGFMSGAAAKTDLCYSSLIANLMNINDYQYPQAWGAGGLPLNLENFLRVLSKKFGNNINGFDWLLAAPTANRLIDQVEDYYERGLGRENIPDPTGAQFFSNVSVQGFQVADAWMITPRGCREEIEKSNNQGDDKDGVFALPNAVFYRTALKVLNPSLNPDFDNFSQLEWLRRHATETEEGVENILLWLGANNALGTVIGLTVNQTGNNQSMLNMSPERRRDWNLWHPNDFKIEYRELLDRINDILEQNQNPNCNVFIGTVPLVTIAPIAKGVGPTSEIDVELDYDPDAPEANQKTVYKVKSRTKATSIYYKYYTYFFRDEEDISKRGTAYLTLADALYIDDCIRQYNHTIRELVDDKNAQLPRNRYHIVDTSKALQQIAYKRNAGQIHYDFPDFFKYQYPQVNTKYYHADALGRLRQGGIVGLDGIHPTAIGQGLIAYEFLKVMKSIGAVNSTELNWKNIFQSDTLYSAPISIMQELYENQQLVELCLSVSEKRQAKRKNNLKSQST
jgi:hypothetical protein